MTSINYLLFHLMELETAVRQFRADTAVRRERFFIPMPFRSLRSCCTVAGAFV